MFLTMFLPKPTGIGMAVTFEGVPPQVALEVGLIGAGLPDHVAGEQPVGINGFGRIHLGRGGREV